MILFEIDNFSEISQNKIKRFETLNKYVINNWNYYLKKRSNTSIDSIDILSSSMELIIKKWKFVENIPIQEIVIWHKEVLEDNEKHFKTGHNFNIFNLLRDNFGFYIQETMHSRLIKFLFDCKETHGQGDLFLLEFLKMQNIESPEIGVWKVTAEIGRIDVLIERQYPQSIIVIENKSNWASDQKNQLYRYWFQAIYQKTKQTTEKFYENNNRKYQILYLVPNTNKELEEQSILKPSQDSESIYRGLPERIPMQITTITFAEHVQNWLNFCLAALPENNHRIREYISQYQSLCNNL